MKLVHPEYKHHIELMEGKSNIIIVEKPEVFYELTKDVYEQCNSGENGLYTLSEEDNLLQFDKNAYVITGPFDIDINNRKIITKLYSNMKEEAYGDDMYMSTNKMLSELYTYYEKLIDCSEYMLEYDEDIDIAGVFKLASLKFANQYESLLENIIDYMGIMQQVMNMNVCFMFNMKAFLSEKEFYSLYEMAQYRKINIVLFEHNMPQVILECERMYVIDKDCCEIY